MQPMSLLQVPHLDVESVWLQPLPKPIILSCILLPSGCPLAIHAGVQAHQPVNVGKVLKHGVSNFVSNKLKCADSCPRLLQLLWQLLGKGKLAACQRRNTSNATDLP